MSGKLFRAIMSVVLLALVITVPSLKKATPLPAHTAEPATIMVEEHGTTAS